jgi:N-acyl-D-aspartate/D-glutamate deacylase
MRVVVRFDPRSCRWLASSALGSAVLLWGLLSSAGTSVVQPAQSALLIQRATIVDGSGAPAFTGEVLVENGRVVQVGKAGSVKASPHRGAPLETFDARGLVVAPGFIDVHTHADDVAERPLAENFIRMGVTSIVAGNCGGSAVDVGDGLARIRAAGVAVNFATLVGHNTVRTAVMGTARRAPTADELARMRALVREAMAEGAVGLSTGLQYVPGTYAEAAEIVELAKEAGSAGGLYASHMRNEGTAIDEAVAETIAVGEAAQCPVQISHLKIDSPSRWGEAARVLGLIDRARQRGLDVEADQYAYTAASSALSIRFPSWVLEGGQPKILERLDDAATWARIKEETIGLFKARGFTDLSFAVVASYRADPTLNGLSIKQIAQRLRGSDSVDAQVEVARLMLRSGGASMVYHLMSESDVSRIMQHPMVALASDASVNTPGQGMPHPRGYGNTVRVLGTYVRDRRVLTLEEAVRKMTSLPAAHFGFADRGLIEPGYAADLVIFDPRTVADRATFDAPHAYPAGLPHVIVNGVFVVRDGVVTGGRPGAILARTEPRHRPREHDAETDRRRIRDR